jgi:hypothetical protein
VRGGNDVGETAEHGTLCEGKRTCGVLKHVGRAEERLPAAVAREAALLLSWSSYRSKVVGRQFSALCSSPHKNQHSVPQVAGNESSTVHDHAQFLCAVVLG